MSELKEWLRFVFSADRRTMPYICRKFPGEILNGFKVIERRRNISIWILTEVCRWASFDRIYFWVLHIVLVWQTVVQSFKYSSIDEKGYVADMKS